MRFFRSDKPKGIQTGSLTSFPSRVHVEVLSFSISSKYTRSLFSSHSRTTLVTRGSVPFTSASSVPHLTIDLTYFLFFFSEGSSNGFQAYQEFPLDGEECGSPDQAIVFAGNFSPKCQVAWNFITSGHIRSLIKDTNEEPL